MASHALAKARETARRAGTRARHLMAQREHTMYSTIAATVIGMAEAKGNRLPEVFGLDGTIVAGVAALLVADSTGGGMQRVMQSFGDGMLAIGAYKMGRSFGGKPISGVGAASDVQAIEAVLSA